MRIKGLNPVPFAGKVWIPHATSGSASHHFFSGAADIHLRSATLIVPTIFLAILFARRFCVAMGLTWIPIVLQ